MSFTEDLYHSFRKNKNRRAFCIGGQDISYGEFLEYINGTSELLNKNIQKNNQPIGIISYSCIETYAAIFAIWFSGNYFVPINPKHPVERNMSIINNIGIQHLISAKKDINEIIETDKLQIIDNSGIKSDNEVEPVKTSESQRMYILTTSGSTGIPKHVPINKENIETYCYGFLDRFPDFQNDACFLQIYDLTVDASFTSYLVPLMVGACVYTLPESPFKFLTVAKMLANKKIDWVKLTPSVFAFLNSYKSQLDFKHLKCIVFGGEALPVSLVNEWIPVFPETKIANHYGPTEATVGVTTYRIDDLQNIRSMNGVVSIGTPFREVDCVIIDENGKETAPGQNGELCFGGKQIMEGYLNGNDSVFINLKINNKVKRFYRTGDIVQKDEEGFIYFLGRKDDQVKIEGHRINLIEVENKVRSLLLGYNAAMVAHEKIPGLKRLYLFVEGIDIDKMHLKTSLASQLPPKMLPEDIFLIPKIPLTVGGKTDKIKLISDYLKDQKQ